MIKFLKSWIRRYQETIVFLLPVVIVLWIFRGILFQNAIFNNGDILFNFYNYLRYYSGGGPVIAQSILSGFPVMSSVAGVWFYPINDVFVHLFGVFRAYGLMDVCNLLLTYFFVYVFARKINISKIASILSASIFVFSGQLMLWADTVTNTNYYFLLPLGLLFVELIQGNIGWRRYLYALILGFISGLGWLSGHVQFVVYIHTLIVVYWIFVSLSFQNMVQFLKKGIALGIAYAVSFLVGYPQIFAILDYKAISARSQGVGLADYWTGALFPQDLLHYVLPFFQIPVIPFASPNLYIGLIPFGLLIFGLFHFKKIKNTYFYFFSGLFAFCLLSSFKYSPVGLVLHYLPLFNSFREAPRIMFLGNFGAAIIIGFVFDYVVSNRGDVSKCMTPCLMWTRKIFLYIVLPISILTAILRFFFYNKIVSVLSLYFVDHMYKNTSGLPKEHYLSLIANYVSQLFDQFSILSWQVFVFVVFLLCSYWLFKKFVEGFDTKRFSLLVLLITLFNFLAVYSGRNVYISEALYNTKPQSVSYVENHRNKENFSERVYTVFPGQTMFREQSVGCPDSSPEENFNLASEFLLPNRNMDFSIDALTGYDNFMPRRISEVLDLVGSEQSVTGKSLAEAKMTPDEKMKIIAERKNLLRSMNTRYLISHYPITDKDFVQVKQWNVGRCAISLRMYELIEYWPRYFLTNRVIVSRVGTSTELNSFVNTLVGSDGLPAVYINEFEHQLLPFASSTNSKEFIAVDPVYGYDSMSFSVSAVNDSVFYVGNAYLPLWKAQIDGKDVAISRVNYSYMAIIVPKGTHHVVFTYKTPKRIPFAL